MKRNFWLSIAFACVSPIASASNWSFVGSLDVSNPNDVFAATFALAVPSPVSIQTWGFGGTSDAAGGTNLAGQVIVPGGSDPYVSLFAGSGPTATFIASNDDGACPPGHAFPSCADSTLVFASLPSGTYTLALTLPFNFSFAENYGSGSLGDGFIGLDASYDDGACAGSCSAAYAVDVRAGGLVSAVPEPSSWAMLLLGVLTLSGRSQRRSRARSVAVTKKELA